VDTYSLPTGPYANAVCQVNLYNTYRYHRYLMTRLSLKVVYL
jgi:hypothetical protein